MPVNTDPPGGGETGTIPLYQVGKFTFEQFGLDDPVSAQARANMATAWNMGYGRIVKLPGERPLTTAEIIMIMDTLNIDPDPMSRALGYTGYYAYPMTNSLYPFPRTNMDPTF